MTAGTIFLLACVSAMCVVAGGLLGDIAERRAREEAAAAEPGPWHAAGRCVECNDGHTYDETRKPLPSGTLKIGERKQTPEGTFVLSVCPKCGGTLFRPSIGRRTRTGWEWREEKPAPVVQKQADDGVIH